MRYAVLTTAELRLLDVLLERGAFPDPPASITRLDLATAATDTQPRSFPHLRARMPDIMAIRRPLGGVVAHGSISELPSLLARPPRRVPAAD